MDYERTEKTISKKIRHKKKQKKTQKIIVKMTLARNYCQNDASENDASENDAINQSEIAACEQKTTSEKANFSSNTVFSLYFKFRAKKFQTAKTTRFFAPFPVSAWQKSLLQFDFKNHENVWTDL